MDCTWLEIQDMHLLVTDTFKNKKKGRGMDHQTSQYLVWPPFASCSTIHLLRRELVRLLIVACGILSHSSSKAVRSCWILVGTGTRCRTRWSIASRTSSVGDLSGEYAGHRRTGTLSVWRNWVQIFATWGRALSCGNMMATVEWHDNGPQDRHGHSVHSNFNCAIVFMVCSWCLPIP